ncbi:MAG TPA: hypothetical protein VKI44_16230 [Acetobacteraceae bacterium]|nr:hypothetical protein [Stellaceae bacterium]HME22856.1 hypothetical protein [Acetobacteraceae bacterium]
MATETGWSEPAPAPSARGTPPAPRARHAPQPSTGPETPPTPEAERAPAFRDETEAETGSAVSVSSLFQADTAPVRAASLSSATPFAIEALAAISPERAPASPLAVPDHPVTAAVPLAQAETPELIARIAASRPRPMAPGEHFEPESLPPAPIRPQPVAAAFVPPPTEIPRSARTPPSYAAGSPASERAPNVQISIGRLEVHAAPARAAPVRAALAQRPPLSLADYLAQRK